MTSNVWERVKLGEVCSFKYGQMPKSSDLTKVGFPVFSGYRIVGAASRFHYREQEIIVVARGVGGTGDVKMSPQMCFLTNLSIAVLVSSGRVDKAFLFYRLGSKRLWELRTGSAQAQITIERLSDYEIELPSLSSQRRIASILSAYDDLIENCQRRIRLLEDMARGLYREWFVHFRFPGADTLPRVDSPLGPIPQGWEVRRIEELMAAHIGGGWGKDSPEDDHNEPAWVIRGTDIPLARACQMSGVPHRFHSASNLRARRLVEGDIVFEVSGGSKGQPVGRTMIVTQSLRRALGDGDVICASFCKRVRPDLDRYGAELMYLSFQEGYESGEIEQYQVQSTGISNFKWMDYIQQTLRTVPTPELRARFRDHVSPLLAQVGTVGLKITNLRRTRDLLLPRLLSGQIDVGVAEESVPA